MGKSHKHAEILDQMSAMLADLRAQSAFSEDAEDPKTGRFQTPSQLVEHLHRLQRIRDEAFGGGLFHDVAWQLLLELFKADCEHRTVYVSSLCVTARRSQTSSLRSLTYLEAAGLISRRPDRDDRRRVLVTLTSEARAAVGRMLERL